MSGGGESAQDGTEVTGFIPISNTSVIRIKNIPYEGDTTRGVVGYDENFNKLTTGNGVNLDLLFNNGWASEENDGVMAIGVSAYTHFSTTDLKYIRLCSTDINENSIITIDEPITESTPAYTNILDVYPIEYNKRWSASNNGYVDCAGMICIAVPLADVVNKTIRMKGFEKDATASGKGASWYIYNGTTKIGTCNASDGSGVVWKSQDLVTDANGVSSIPINAATFGSVTNGTTLYISLAVGDWVTVSSADLLGKIITIDQEIV
jgi:hypothetical protein